MKREMFLSLGLSTLLFALAGLAQGADAVDSMRCGSKLVMVGDTKLDITSKCGEPAAREKFTKSTTVNKSKKRGTKGETHSQENEQWIYNFGPKDFTYTLAFEGVELKSISRGGRGTRR
jgi:hypothetical protein